MDTNGDTGLLVSVQTQLGGAGQTYGMQITNAAVSGGTAGTLAGLTTNANSAASTGAPNLLVSNQASVTVTAGTTTAAQAFRGGVAAIGATAVIGTFTGLSIQTPFTSGGGSITSVYGIKLEDQTGGVSANYAIHTGKGQVRLGDTTTISGATIIDADQTSASSNIFSITTNAGSTNNLVFRIQADGSSFSDNAHSTSGADYAEWFETAASDLKPGDLACIDVTRSNSVKKCSSDGDSNVMGIISTNPSVIGNAVKGKTITSEGFGRPGYALVGLIGQIPAKAMADVVSTASGTIIESIRPGDSLAAASKPGYVRRARAGEATVGVALEGLLMGEGTIKVLIARSNKSITTELMEEKVRSNIAALKIDDEIALSMQKGLESLDLEKTVKSITEEDTARLEETIESLKAQIASLSGSLVQTPAPEAAPVTFSGSAIVDSLTANSTLTVVSDARIGGDLYLEGTLKVNSLFVPGGMRVDGGLEVGDTLTADKIVAGSGSQVTGLLKINEAILSSTGAAISMDQLFVKGAMEVLGDITIRGLAKFLGGGAPRRETNRDRAPSSARILSGRELSSRLLCGEPNKMYCQVVIAPKIEKLKKDHRNLLSEKYK
jgi:hypothetical protein